MIKYLQNLFFCSLLCATPIVISGPATLDAATYSMGSLVVTTFEENVQLNGSPITPQSTDTLTFLSNGSMTINGSGTPYSVLLGSGEGARVGFDWGTGGTISLADEVTLSIDVAAGTSSPLVVVPLTQNGSGTLALTSPGSENFQLTQNAGTLEVTGDIETLGNVVINGTVTTAGNFTANANSPSVDTVNVNGSLNITGEYMDIADQTNVRGSLTAATVDFQNGGLYVYDGGEFLISGEAIFSTNTAVINAGDMSVGDNSEFDSTTVADIGTLTIGDGTAFTGTVGNAGTIIANGTVDFNNLRHYSGSITAQDDVQIFGEFEADSGSLSFEKNATFNNTAILQGGTNMTIGGSADFQNTLTLMTSAAVNVTGDITSSNDVSLTDSTLTSGGNISITGDLDLTGSSTLGLSNRLQGAELGNLEVTGTIDLASTTTITTDLSPLNNVKTPMLLVHMTSGTSTSDFLINGAPTDTETVAAFFGTSTLLRQIYAIDNGSGYDIYGSVRSIASAAGDAGLPPPAVSAGEALDNMIGNITPSDPTYEMVEDLLDQTDQDAINQTLYNLAGGYGIENIFAMTLVNLGQAGSPFFMGKPAGNSRITNDGCSCCQNSTCSRSERWDLWGAPFYQSLDAEGNFYQPGFNLHETGLIVGARRDCSDQFSMGVLFAYGAPRLSQSGGLAGYDAFFHSDLELDDYQFAGHMEYRTMSDFRFSLFVGGGAQTLDLTRNSLGTASNGSVMDQTFTGATDGNTLSITAYLSKPIYYNERIVFSPVIGLDCMYMWLYGFGEEAAGTGNWQEMTNLSEGNFYSPVGYSRTDYNRIMFRAGLTAEYLGNRGGFTGQAFYGNQLGGDDYALVPIQTMGGAFNSLLYGYGVGYDSLNLGGGYWRYLNEAQTVTASLDYNYFTLNGANGSNVSASLVCRY